MNWFKGFWKALTVPMPRETEHSMEPLNNFTPRAQQVLALARKEADDLHHNFVGTEHLLLGLIRLGQGTAVTVLARLGLDLETVRAEVEKHIGKGPDEKSAWPVPYTPRVKKVLTLAAKEARALNHTYVGTEHILLGLLREGDGVAARVLKALEVDVDATRNEILRQLDPNYEAATTGTVLSDSNPKSDLLMRSAESIDTTKRYDVYCSQREEVVIYQKVLFKGAKRLFPNEHRGILPDFVELEQADGKTVFVARSSIIRFCEHSAPPGSEKPPDQTP